MTAEHLTGVSQSWEDLWGRFLVSSVKGFLCFSTPGAQRGNAGVGSSSLHPFGLVLPAGNSTWTEGATPAPQRLQELPENRCPCSFPWHLSHGIVAIKSGELLQCSSQGRDWASALILRFIRELLKSGAAEVGKGMETWNMPRRIFVKRCY